MVYLEIDGFPSQRVGICAGGVRTFWSELPIFKDRQKFREL